uniref:sodium:solute symporter n=1 Tax=Algoriphagus sp. TaxID=1872435 RepID=UPI0040471FF6
MQILDLAIFLIYMLAIVGFGISFSFRKRTAQDFTTGGGRLPTWTIGMSIFATYVSSISFLALPGNAYMTNWNGLVFSFSIPLAAWVAVNYFVPLYRKLKCESAYFYLEQRFGAWARIYASCCYLLTQLARMGAIVYLIALPMNAFLGWSIPVMIILIGFSVLLYAMWGGIEAVIWADAVQGIVLIFGALACLGVILFGIPNGPEAIFSSAADADKFSLGSFKLEFTSSTFWMILVYGLFINLQNFGIDQSYVQRYLTANSEGEAKKATWFGSLLYVPVSFVFFFMGTALFAYYESFPDLLPEGIIGDKVFPHFIVNQLPVGLTGLLIASIFAAGMSTVSTSINSSATVILSDHFSKYIYPNPSEKLSLRVLRISSLVMGLLSILVGLAFNGVSNTLEGWWALSSIFSGGILGLFLLGLLSKAKNPQAIFAVFSGVMVICWMSLSTILIQNGLPQTLSNPLHTNMTIVIGTMTIFLVGFGLTWAVKKSRG